MKSTIFCRSTAKLTCVKTRVPGAAGQRGAVVKATHRLCDDVTPLAVTSQSGRPASNDAMMFSICHRAHVFSNADKQSVTRCKLVRNPHISEQTLDSREMQGLRGIFGGRGQCHIARYEQFIFVLLHHHHHHHHHHHQKCNSLTNKDSF